MKINLSMTETSPLINAMSCHIKVNSSTIELTVHLSCFCALDLLCVMLEKPVTCIFVAINYTSIKISRMCCVLFINFLLFYLNTQLSKGLKNISKKYLWFHHFLSSFQRLWWWLKLLSSIHKHTLLIIVPNINSHHQTNPFWVWIYFHMVNPWHI